MELLTNHVRVAELLEKSNTLTLHQFNKKYKQRDIKKVGVLKFINKDILDYDDYQTALNCLDMSDYVSSTELSIYFGRNSDHLSHMRLKENKPIEFIKIGNKYTMIKLTKEFIDRFKQGLVPRIINSRHDYDLLEVYKEDIIDFYGIKLLFNDGFNVENLGKDQLIYFLETEIRRNKIKNVSVAHTDNLYLKFENFCLKNCKNTKTKLSRFLLCLYLLEEYNIVERISLAKNQYTSATTFKVKDYNWTL